MEKRKFSFSKATICGHCGESTDDHDVFCPVGIIDRLRKVGLLEQSMLMAPTPFLREHHTRLDV